MRFIYTFIIEWEPFLGCRFDRIIYAANACFFFFFFWDLNCGVKVIGPNRLFQLCGIMEQKKKKAPKSETNIKSSGKKKVEIKKKWRISMSIRR